ncbi:acyltransferase [Williamsia herbipolensis]|uniref:Acyltransferase n=1 Tax=Williamsia herbipolensis TaxID=1603258 RepID=A0AAU4K705_9NOCA|nr:acyltransferase [Williamsia herbipolensis]
MRKLARYVVDTALAVFANSFIGSHMIPVRLRPRLYNLLGHRIHPSTTINTGVFLGARTGLTTGPNCYINHRCFFDLGGEVILEENVGLSYEVMVVTYDHAIAGSDSRVGFADPTRHTTVIEKGTWIGARSIIMPGVRIGAGVVIAAGSVVTSDCEPNTLYAGVPAVAKRSIS